MPDWASLPYTSISSTSSEKNNVEDKKRRRNARHAHFRNVTKPYLSS